jgi:hypothetical protein
MFNTTCLRGAPAEPLVNATLLLTPAAQVEL